MKILRQNIGEEAKLAKYNRLDMEPIEGAVTEIKWYIVNEAEKPSINQFEFIKTNYETTDKPNEKYPHFFVANEVHTVERISDEQIIEQLNSSLGEWLDSNYLVPTQIKHLYELISNKASELKKQNVASLTTWQEQCRILRDQREADLFNSGILPELIWPNPPTVLKSTKI
jgi:hypothetical protein